MSQAWRVLVVEAFDRSGMDLLEARPDIALDVVAGPAAPDFEARLAAAHAVTLRMTPFGADLIAKAPALRVVSRHGVGYDTVDVDALTARGIPLAVVGEANAVTVAEHTLCLMLGLARRLKAYDAAARRGEFAWRLRAESVELAGKTVLLVGFGRIGSEVARRCAAFGMRILVHDPHLSAAAIARAGGLPASDLDAALGEADVVSLHLPLTAATRHIVDAARLGRMKPGAILVNTARGGLVDEKALAAALADGRLSGAGLDVFERQPPATDSPLFRMENVLLTPHSAGMTREAAARIAVACAQNVLDALDGRLNPANVVNPEVLEAAAPAATSR
jgi:D-3-phosphoglycerate dehydrogenase